MEDKSVYFLLKKDPFIQTGSFKKISCGVSHILFLTEDSTVYATGMNYSGQCTIPDEVKAAEIVDIVAGDSHNLALASTGQLFAWGRNTDGQHTYTGQVDMPEHRGKIVSIAADVYWSGCSYDNGTVAVWGDNSTGQCLVPNITNAKQIISAGEGNIFCILETGELVGWGDKNNNVPGRLRYDNKFVAGGQYHHFCIRTNNSVHGWGTPTSNELEVPNPNNIKYICAAGEHPGWTLFLHGDGTLTGSGSNKYGQCMPDQPYNTKCTGTHHKKFKHISTGLTWSVGITETGSVYGWGMIDVE